MVCNVNEQQVLETVSRAAQGAESYAEGNNGNKNDPNAQRALWVLVKPLLHGLSEQNFLYIFIPISLASS